MNFDVYVLDTNVLGRVLKPGENSLLHIWISEQEFDDISIVVPEIVDYELRRELIRSNKENIIQRLDDFIFDVNYIPISTAAMRLAAELWAKARNEGYQSAPNTSLDGDVILAAQTIELKKDGYSPVIITDNVKHLNRYTQAESWGDL